ncbi:MAG TPA: metallophosphoesterase family protein [Candidatus Eisenbacteria bacterium]|nr:metallophosphoesterase family protein [Candidatus Eisenbacteria bacterium]
MRVAALYDIHGNLRALEAVLADVVSSGVDRVVVGGDTVPGPWPRKTLDRLLALDLPIQFIHGNCERSVLAQMAALTGAPVTYWGTTSGKPLPEKDQAIMRWTAAQLGPDDERLFAAWPRTLRLSIDGLGDVLFCHATPRSETEIFTRLTPEERLLPLFQSLGVSLVVCGHTHMQFDRMVGKTRVVNSGSVGAPIGQTGAFWTLLGPGVEHRRTRYDLERTAEEIRGTRHPQAAEQAKNLLDPPNEEETLALFESFAVK